MKYSLSDKILLLIARYLDFNHAILSTNRALSYLAGDPDMRKNYFQILKSIEESKKRKRLYDTLYMLYKRRYLKRLTSDGKEGYLLTDKGKLHILELKQKYEKRKKLPHGKMLMVFFDIPESKRIIRNTFREHLKHIGFEQWQKSIWVTPYDVVEATKATIKSLKVSEETELLLVNRFDDR